MTSVFTCAVVTMISCLIPAMRPDGNERTHAHITIAGHDDHFFHFHF